MGQSLVPASQVTALRAHDEEELLIICDVLNAIPKNDMASMEHPIFSLSTRPDRRVLKYAHNNVTLEIIPSLKGLATIHDKDILIYCGSQLMAKKNRGEQISRLLHLNAQELLKWTHRETGGDSYRRLKEAFERLKGTQIVTNIKMNSEEIAEADKAIGLIESWEMIRRGKSNRMVEIQVKLSDWFYKEIVGCQVLTISRDYFGLRKPTDRRIYELARKHCGDQDEWSISLGLLHKKTGASSHAREFKSMVKELVEADHLPDYRVSLEEDMVTFRSRASSPKAHIRYPVLDAEAYHDAKLVAPGYDVYALEQEWRNWWVDSGMPELGFPAKAFVGFCKSRYQRKPNP